MKNTAKLLKIALLLFFVGNFAAAVKAESTPEQTAKNFYQFYLKETTGAFSDTGSEINKKKVSSYLSKRLVKWYQSQAYEDYGADYFFDAQDYDDKWQVSTTNGLIKGNTATLKIVLAVPKAKKSDWTNTLTIKMVKEDGAWKIDSVNNRKLTS